MKTVTLGLLHESMTMLMLAAALEQANKASLKNLMARVNMLIHEVSMLPEVSLPGTKRTAEERDLARRTATKLWAAAIEASHLVGSNTPYTAFTVTADYAMTKADENNVADMKAVEGYPAYHEMLAELHHFAANDDWGDAADYLAEQVTHHADDWPPSLGAQAARLSDIYTNIRTSIRSWRKGHVA